MQFLHPPDTFLICVEKVSLAISSPLEIRHKMLQTQRQHEKYKFPCCKLDIMAADRTVQGTELKVVMVFS
jgi:hypothetical protein